THGSMGIGTLHGLDGELVIVDGIAYQVTVDGEILKVNGAEKTPYAAVTHFEAEDRLEIENNDPEENLKETLKSHYSSKNTVEEVIVTGTRHNILCRSGK